MDDVKKVVVVGGGFAGINLIKKLAKDKRFNCRIQDNMNAQVGEHLQRFTLCFFAHRREQFRPRIDQIKVCTKILYLRIFFAGNILFYCADVVF